MGNKPSNKFNVTKVGRTDAIKNLSEKNELAEIRCEKLKTMISCCYFALCLIQLNPLYRVTLADNKFSFDE